MNNSQQLIAAGAALTLLFASGCATPREKYDERANELGLQRQHVAGTEFEHIIFSPGEPSTASVLHVYLEGDTSPRMASRYSPPDPTPHLPLMLELMAMDPSPSLLLGRPCQHGPEHGCGTSVWTVERYGERLVASLVAALERVRISHGAEEIVLVGYSGGGALAMLMAERVPETRAVITLAGNLDTEAWAEHHDYFPLALSLNPADRPPLHAAIVQIHLVGERDERVPPFLTGQVIAQQKGAKTLSFADFDHTCCWASAWPDVLAQLSLALSPVTAP
ncbi:MAG: hypothetical protein P8Q97_09265 [Myxococcota bacterium]|nr:hypothetical protein [Myxococcota bacterium]